VLYVQLLFYYVAILSRRLLLFPSYFCSIVSKYDDVCHLLVFSKLKCLVWLFVVVVTLYILWILIELNCLFMIPTSAPLIYTSTVLYYSYTHIL
jgi:hypothetical protein